MEPHDSLQPDLRSQAINMILLSTAFSSRSLLSAPLKFVIYTLAPMETAVFCPSAALHGGNAGPAYAARQLAV